MIACTHDESKRFGRDRRGNQRFRCLLCGKTWAERKANPLGNMRIPLEMAKLALRMLVEGNSIRSTERITGLHRDTICRLLVFFGEACQRFLDDRMRGLTLGHLQFDEQWTWVGRKQARLTVDEKAERHDVGDVYIWTCIDERTKLMPSFLIGKRSADNARRFMLAGCGGRNPTPAMPMPSSPKDTSPSCASAPMDLRRILRRSIWHSARTFDTAR